jgi:hypothetical protein
VKTPVRETKFTHDEMEALYLIITSLTGGIHSLSEQIKSIIIIRCDERHTLLIHRVACVRSTRVKISGKICVHPAP